MEKVGPAATQVPLDAAAASLSASAAAVTSHLPPVCPSSSPAPLTGCPGYSFKLDAASNW